MSEQHDPTEGAAAATTPTDIQQTSVTQTTPTSPTERLDTGTGGAAPAGAAQFPGSRMDWFPMGPATSAGPTGSAGPAEPVGPTGAGGTAGHTAPGVHPTGGSSSTEPSAPQRRSARFGTILWGVLLLTFAAAIVTNAVTAISIDPVTSIITALIGVGAILIVAGIAAAIRR